MYNNYSKKLANRKIFLINKKIVQVQFIGVEFVKIKVKPLVVKHQYIKLSTILLRPVWYLKFIWFFK